MNVYAEGEELILTAVGQGKGLLEVKPADRSFMALKTRTRFTTPKKLGLIFIFFFFVSFLFWVVFLRDWIHFLCVLVTQKTSDVRQELWDLKVESTESTQQHHHMATIELRTTPQNNLIFTFFFFFLFWFFVNWVCCHPNWTYIWRDGDGGVEWRSLIDKKIQKREIWAPNALLQHDHDHDHHHDHDDDHLGDLKNANCCRNNEHITSIIKAIISFVNIRGRATSEALNMNVLQKKKKKKTMNKQNRTSLYERWWLENFT